MFEVFKKEVKELLRDKKTLLFVVALPVLIFWDPLEQPLF